MFKFLGGKGITIHKANGPVFIQNGGKMDIEMGQTGKYAFPNC